MPDDELAEDRNRIRERDLYYQYEWILSDDLMATRLHPDNHNGPQKVLVYNYIGARAAILELDPERQDGQEVHTNGVFIDWGDDFPAILGIFDQAYETSPMTWIMIESMEDEDRDDGMIFGDQTDMDPEQDSPEELLAIFAATQPPDNFVHLMSCGHQYDSAMELMPGTDVTCSQHGPQKITGGFDGPRGQ